MKESTLILSENCDCDRVFQHALPREYIKREREICSRLCDKSH